MDFKQILHRWFEENQRDLPWRDVNNPYKVWVSEIILQQTRVAQGMSYYLRFIERFPTVESLAQASEDEVLKYWQGLGYYSRARNMLVSAKYITHELGGVFPSTYEELLKLKGVGEYSAGAIASFAFKQPVPAIDGNVYRVISRIFGVFESPHNAAGKRTFRAIVEEVMDKDQPDCFNQALLDFGALQCVPRSPNCNSCPFAEYCYAYRNNVIEALPVKAPKLKVRDRYFTYLLIRYQSHTFITKRDKKDIWRSLYEFPLIETTSPLLLEQMVAHKKWKKLLGHVKPQILHISATVKHLLSHQVIWAQFVIVSIDKLSTKITDAYMRVPTDSLSDYAIPTLIDNFLVAEPAEEYFLNPPNK